jgi:CubicO group peptidase (beta-lactamase class C family)
MNTATTSPAVAGLFARKVREITGLLESDIYRLHTSDMGSPGHFLYQSGAEGGMFYTVAGLSRLVEILFSDGCKAEATMLRTELDKLRTPAPAAVAPPGRNERGNWALDWEASHQ